MDCEWHSKASMMANDEDDMLHDACGVIGCVTAAPWPNTAIDPAVDVIYPALANLQHRYVTAYCMYTAFQNKYIC